MSFEASNYKNLTDWSVAIYVCDSKNHKNINLTFSTILLAYKLSFSYYSNDLVHGYE